MNLKICLYLYNMGKHRYLQPMSSLGKVNRHASSIEVGHNRAGGGSSSRIASWNRRNPQQPMAELGSTPYVPSSGGNAGYGGGGGGGAPQFSKNKPGNGYNGGLGGNGLVILYANANALNVDGNEVAAGKFLRSDDINTTEFGINVRNNNGITIGVDGTFNVATTSTAAKIYNSATGSSLDLQTNRNGIPATIIRVIDNKVGINQSTQ
jgi:hypothetical protein